MSIHNLHLKVYVIVFFFFPYCSVSQKEMTVQECIDLGVKNSKLLISQQSNLNRSAVDRQFGKWSFLPTVSAAAGYNMSYGRKLDPFTNTFGINSVFSNSYGLTSQFMLFEGLKYFKQNQLFEMAITTTKLDYNRTVEKVKNQILEKCILIWKAQLKIEQQMKIINNLKVFKERQTELISEGRLSAIDTVETMINIKTQLITLLNFKQQLSYETINLNYYLELPLMNETKLEPYTSVLTKYELTIDEYYQVEDLKNKLQIAELQYKIDKTQFVPSLSLYGNIGTGYSTNNKDYAVLNTPVIPYSTQIPHNAYQGLGISLSVPLFNKFEWYKKQRIYEITKTEQVELIGLKELEIEKKKFELQVQKQYLEESLRMQKGILHDKETIFTTTQLIYLEGKIRLSEVEKVQTEYYNYIQTIQDLEIELVKLNMIKMD